MRAELLDKLDRLKLWASSYDRCAIAYSGGVDSSFLLTALVRAGLSPILAVSVDPPYVPDWEIAEASAYVSTIKEVEHHILSYPIPESILDNPEDRCYLCKRELFNLIKKEAESWGAEILMDGTNADDTGDHRPGMRALRELKVKSPLLELGFTKSEIREISAEWELPFADKPAYSCLLTRIPHDTRVTPEALRRIESAEVFLHELGFPAVRVRTHGELARIELAAGDMVRFLSSDTMGQTDRALKGFGYRFVTCDLGGYSMGNMNSIDKRGGDDE